MNVKFKDAEELFSGRLRGNQLMLSGRGLGVITSYSIHYTKLYDQW